MPTKHNVYFDGAVQSLGANSEGQDFTVGTVQPGIYDFGIAEHQEDIQVLIGFLRINGAIVAAGEKVSVPKGAPINIVASETAAYICYNR